MNKGMRYEDLVLIKTAGEMKDKDYDIKVPAAGADTPVEDSGYDLVEGIAHPDQIQVSNSFRNDGIFENGVEKQKAMVDIALRNPRGVLVGAELMKLLVKAANILEADMTDESLKIAAEIDSLLVKMAQESPIVNHKGILENAKSAGGDLYTLMTETAQALKGIGLGHWWRSNNAADKVMKEKLQTIVQKIDEYGALEVRLSDAPQSQELFEKTREAIAFIFQSNQLVLDAVNASTDWDGSGQMAGAEWKLLMDRAGRWNEIITKYAPFVDKSQHPQEIVDKNKVNTTHAPKERAGLSNRTPGAHRYSIGGPSDPAGEASVKALQTALGMSGDNVDGKFGPNTFSTMMSKINQVQPNNGLKDMPRAQSYEGWNKDMIDAATSLIAKHSSQQNVSSNMPGKDGLIDPYTPDANKATQSNNDLAWQDFKDRYRPKYKDIEVENGLVYPFGMEDGRKYRVTSDGRWQKA